MLNVSESSPPIRESEMNNMQEDTNTSELLQHIASQEFDLNLSKLAEDIRRINTTHFGICNNSLIWFLFSVVYSI